MADMGYGGFGYGGRPMLGDRYTGGQGSRLAALLARQNYNNGTNAGGLATVLQGLMQGMALKGDADTQAKLEGDMTAANNAMVQGMSAKPWVNPDTGQAQGTAGGYEGGLAALQNLGGDNAPAGKLSQALLMNKVGRDQQLADNATKLQQQKDLLKFGIDNKPEMVAPGNTVLIGGKPIYTAPQKLTPGVDVPLPQNVADQKIAIADASSRGGNYYAVQTSTGTILINKKDGSAQQMGQDTEGNLVPIGQPFQFVQGSNGQPTNIPQPGTPGPAMASQSMPANAAHPILAPSIDPTAQGAVAAARASGTKQGDVQGAAAADMGSATQSKDYILGLIDSVANHPDLGKATGFSSYLPAIPGYNTDVRARVAQLQGNNFLQAYQTLKGGGAITETEGVQAKEAQARLNAAQTEGEFKTALKDMADLINKRYAVKQNQAGANVVLPGQPMQQNAAPQSSGIRFLGFEK